MLVDLAGWLEASGCTHVAMESTGIYWRPVLQILEEKMTVLLVNAAHVSKVPGRKTDVKDCEWIAEYRDGVVTESCHMRLTRCGR